MPKRKKPKKVKPKVVRGVSQVVKVTINQAKSVRRKSYMKPNPTQGNNLMIPQLISTRQDPIDLRAFGDLQQRVNKIDNLSAGLYDRDFAMEMQNQETQKKREKEDIGIRQEKNVTPAEARPKRGAPYKTPIQVADPVGGQFTDMQGAAETRQLFPDLGSTSVPPLGTSAEIRQRGRSFVKKEKKKEDIKRFLTTPTKKDSD